jgi:hypothetical protein
MSMTDKDIDRATMQLHGIRGRRLEIGLTLAAMAARVTLLRNVGTGAGSLVLAALVVGLVAFAPARNWVLRVYREERFQQFCTHVFVSAGFELDHAPDVVSRRPTPSGAIYDLRLSPKCTVKDLEKRTEPLAVALGAAGVRINRDRTAASRAELVVTYRDPLADAPIPWPWVDAQQTQLWSGLPLGYDEDGALVALELAGHHVLLGGEPGAGKSNALSLIVAAAALDPTTELWCFDGKLVELAAWRRSCRRFVGPDIEEATEALTELQTEMEARYSWLLARGLRKMDQDTGWGLVVVVIDELALYLQGKGKARDQLVEVLRDIVARGRAAGVVVVAATQKPASDVVPTSIRDLFGYRLAMRCATRDASDTVLGAGWASEGYTASDIDPASRGVGYLLAEGSLPRRMRCFVLSDEHLGYVARNAEHIRGTTPWPPP